MTNGRAVNSNAPHNTKGRLTVLIKDMKGV